MMRRSLVFLCLSLFILFCFFSCDEVSPGVDGTDSSAELPVASESVSDDTESKESEEMTTDNVTSEKVEDPMPDELVATVFPNQYSGEFRLLGFGTTVIETPFTENEKKLRVRAETDGVKISLDKIEYLSLFDYYRKTEEIASVNADPGAVYEFSYPVPGKISEYRISAVKNGRRSEYLIKSDENENAIELICTEWTPSPITLASPELALARSVAIAHARHGELCSDSVSAEVIASAIASRLSFEYTEETEYFETERWLALAYMRAALPDRESLPSDDAFILPSAEDEDTVRTVPLYYDGIAAASIFDISESEDGSVSVRYDVIVYSDDAPPRLTGRVVTLVPAFDADSPFEYNVADVHEISVE